MTKLTCFELTVQKHIAHLVMNRPDRMNTLDMTYWRELDQVLQNLHQTSEARVLVMSSTGKHFSAGMSLDSFGGAIAMDDSSAEGRSAIADMLAGLQATFTRLETLRMPVIAVIQGGCVGGAVDLVTAACLRYASADAFFCIQEINIGMVADVGTLQRLPKLLPMTLVKELAYTGRRLSAEKAQAWGLVNEVLPNQEACLAAAMPNSRNRLSFRVRSRIAGLLGHGQPAQAVVAGGIGDQPRRRHAVVQAHLPQRAVVARSQQHAMAGKPGILADFPAAAIHDHR